MKRVLIIEDDPDTCACLAVALTLEGYDVSQAQDGREGLREAGENRPDLILLDLMMPRMNGWQFRAAQKRDPTLADIPVIITSAVAAERWDETDEVAARFPKPFDIQDLLAAVNEHVAAAGCGAAARQSGGS